jgi:ribonuclease-3
LAWKILSIPKGKSKSDDQKLVTAIKNLAGLSPSNLNLYKLATVHSSIAKESKNGFKDSNERLEYLGDAILGAAVADYLFKKFPYKNEGFLTEKRSRLVNRES